MLQASKQASSGASQVLHRMQHNWSEGGSGGQTEPSTIVLHTPTTAPDTGIHNHIQSAAFNNCIDVGLLCLCRQKET